MSLATHGFVPGDVLEVKSTGTFRFAGFWGDTRESSGATGVSPDPGVAGSEAAQTTDYAHREQKSAASVSAASVLFPLLAVLVTVLAGPFVRRAFKT